jgi:tripartite-type tricarboxylate transporter receptor subunit TctC
MKRRTFVVNGAAALGAGLGPSITRAQSWPARPVRVFEPNAPGSATDVTLRALAAPLQAGWGQALVVDNRPGASGTLALQALTGAQADGYTLAHATNNMFSANPHLFTAASVDPFSDVVLAAPVSNVALVLVVRADSPWKSLAELLEDARRNSGKLSYGTPGVATPMHLIMELVKQQAKADLIHVPYKGGPLVISDVIAGQVSLGVLAYGPAAGLIQQGRLRALASAGSLRLSMLPDVPAVAETVPEASFGAWTALVAPKGTPRDICAELARQVQTVFKRPEVADRLRPMGVELLAGSDESVLASARAEHARFGEIIKRLNLKV